MKWIVVVLLLLPWVFSDYIAVDTKTSILCHITENGAVSELLEMPGNFMNAYAAFLPPDTYFLAGPSLFSFKTSILQPSFQPYNNSVGLSGFCVSQKTHTFYAFNNSMVYKGGNYSLVSMSTNATTSLLSVLSINYGEEFQQCVVDDTHDVIYWVTYHAESSQEICNILMTDLHTYSTRSIFSVANDHIAIFLGAAGQLIVLDTTTSTIMYVATLANGGEQATLVELTFTVPPSDLSLMVGPTNPNTNSAVLFGSSMYMWPFSKNSTLQTIPYTYNISVHGYTAAWIARLGNYTQ